MVEVVTAKESIVLRMRSALHEEWTEGRVLLRKCIRSGTVNFCDLLLLVSELIDIWPSVRPYIRCTGLAHVKEMVDSVDISFPFFCFRG